MIHEKVKQTISKHSFYVYTHYDKRLPGEKQHCQTMDGIIAKQEHLFLWITGKAATSAKTQDYFSLLATFPRGVEVLKAA